MSRAFTLLESFMPFATPATTETAPSPQTCGPFTRAGLRDRHLERIDAGLLWLAPR